MGKHKQKKHPFWKIFTRTLGLGVVLCALLLGGSSGDKAYANHTCDDGTPIPHGSATQAENFCASQAPGQSARLQGDCETVDASNCGIIEYVIIAINVLSAVVGVIVVIMIVIGGIQYTAARDNPQAVADARQRIINALMGLVFYMGIAAFLQWLIPGGVFS